MKKGFTLIELLIAIAIIGILAAVVLSAIGVAAKKKTRDAHRIAELRSIASALEVYKADHGYYPRAGIETPQSSFNFDYSKDGSPFLEILVTEGYMSESAADPINSGPSGIWRGAPSHYYAYGGTTTGENYMLMANLESGNKHSIENTCGNMNSRWTGGWPTSETSSSFGRVMYIGCCQADGGPLPDGNCTSHDEAGEAFVINSDYKSACSDGIDNDGDGDIDAADSHCWPSGSYAKFDNREN